MARFLLVFFLICPLLRAGEEEKKVAELYARGLAGEKQAVIDCIAVLQRHLEQVPQDQLARVYLGSAWTLRSRDLPIGFSKISALRKGIRLMDEAAAAAPKDAKILLLRAVTNEALPAFLGRRQTARAQLEELLGIVEKEPGRLEPADRELLYLNAGRAAAEAGEKDEARQLWERGLTIKADPKLSAEIRAALAK